MQIIQGKIQIDDFYLVGTAAVSDAGAMCKDHQTLGKAMLFEPFPGIHLPALGPLTFMHVVYAVGELKPLASRIFGADSNFLDQHSEPGYSPGGGSGYHSTITQLSKSHRVTYGQSLNRCLWAICQLVE